MIDLYYWPTIEPVAGLDATPHLARWTAELRARPAVQRGLAVLAEKRRMQGQLTDEARSILFGERQMQGR